LNSSVWSNKFEALVGLVNQTVGRRPTLYHNLTEEFPKTEELLEYNQMLEQ